MKRAKRYARLSEPKDTALFPATCKSAAAVILNGTYKGTFFRCSTGIAHSRRLIHTHTQRGKWDLIIAHPPCTYLSNAGACRMYRIIDGERYINEKRLNEMKAGKAFFLKFLNADCERIAVENPTPMKLCELPPASQVIQPYEFGHPYSKRTLLWLKGLPPLFPTDIFIDHSPYLPSNTSAYAKGAGGSKGAIRGSKNYAKTFPGIAKAMADQWG